MKEIRTKICIKWISCTLLVWIMWNFVEFKKLKYLSGAELREIQKQIENLPHPMDPRTIADFLAMRRDVMFLEFDTAVRHCMMDTFLSTGNAQSFHVSVAFLDVQSFHVSVAHIHKFWCWIVWNNIIAGLFLM